MFSLFGMSLETYATVGLIVALVVAILITVFRSIEDVNHGFGLSLEGIIITVGIAFLSGISIGAFWIIVLPIFLVVVLTHLIVMAVKAITKSAKAKN